jgi:hypothetical protein
MYMGVVIETNAGTDFEGSNWKGVDVVRMCLMRIG